MHILMSRPEHFEIIYEINPWMHIENQARTKRCMNQWQRLYDHYHYLGVEVELLDQPHGLPDFVFTANGGFVYGKKVILPSFNPVQRRPETPYFRKWFEDHGYECHTVKNYFEGEGDALFYGDTLCLGHGQRTVIESHAEVRHLLDVKSVSLELIDPRFYHLDTCFAPLGDVVLYYPEAFSRDGCAAIEKLAPPKKRIVLSYKEAEDFAANCVLIDDVVVSSCALKSFEHKLWGIGLDSNAFELDEFMKAGGSAKCLTLKLNNP
jgi:N-dimethylarginine dimethylaminohydrolase